MAKKKQTSNPDQPKPKAPVAAKQQPANKAVSGRPAYNWYVIILMAVAFIINARTISYDYTYDDAVFTSKGNLIDLPLADNGGIYCSYQNNNSSRE